MVSKGNDGTGNVPERDLWATKQTLWVKLDKQYNFLFDCCASKQDARTADYSSKFETIKKEDVVNITCWMNPPFSNAFDMFIHFFDVVEAGVAIFRCDNMETKVWQDVILKKSDWVLIPKGRVSYTPFEVGNMRKGAWTRFPSALIGVNVHPPKYIGGSLLFTSKNRGDE